MCAQNGLLVVKIVDINRRKEVKNYEINYANIFVSKKEKIRFDYSSNLSSVALSIVNNLRKMMKEAGLAISSKGKGEVSVLKGGLIVVSS